MLRSRSLTTARDSARRGRGTGTGSARGAPRGPRYGMRAASPAVVSGREGLPPDPAWLHKHKAAAQREGESQRSSVNCETASYCTSRVFLMACRAVLGELPMRRYALATLRVGRRAFRVLRVLCRATRERSHAHCADTDGASVRHPRFGEAHAMQSLLAPAPPRPRSEKAGGCTEGACGACGAHGEGVGGRDTHTPCASLRLRRSG